MWLKAARASRGWSQRDLALRVGVGQQTVSSWERGRTVPDPDLLQLVRSAVGAAPGKPPASAPAVGLPRLSGLPFKILDEYVFEAFCAELAAEVFPGAQVERFGGRGEEQHGIDVRVATQTGERIGIQAKRYDKYHPATFRAAVDALDMAEARVDRCLLWVTATVTVRVRQEVDKQPDWELWDAEDLAREVAGLDKDVAVRLVDRYFPGLREPFLGVSAPTPWETPDEAFDQFRQGDRYSHRWTLVGRADELERLAGFVSDDTADASMLGLLIGAAGAGEEPPAEGRVPAAGKGQVGGRCQGGSPGGALAGGIRAATRHWRPSRGCRRCAGVRSGAALLHHPRATSTARGEDPHGHPPLWPACRP